MEKESQATSHKWQKLKHYSLKFKLDAISFAAIHGNHAAEKKYNVDRKRILEWQEKKESIEKTVKSKKTKGCQRKRVEGGGRKPFSEKLDETVLEWVHERQSKGLRVSRKLIMKKVEVLYDDMVKNGEPNKPFKASNGWLRGFMKRYGLSLRQKTFMAQKDPDHLINKLVAFVLHVRRVSMKHLYDAASIIAMDGWNPFLVRHGFWNNSGCYRKKNCQHKNNWAQEISHFGLPCSQSRWYKTATFHCFQRGKTRNCCIG